MNALLCITKFLTLWTVPLTTTLKSFLLLKHLQAFRKSASGDLTRAIGLVVGVRFDWQIQEEEWLKLVALIATANAFDRGSQLTLK